MGKRPALFAVVICPGCLDVYIDEQPETCDACGVATITAILKLSHSNASSIFLPTDSGNHHISALGKHPNDRSKAV